MGPEETTPSAAGIRRHLRQLRLERMIADEIGLTSSSESYRAHLEREIADTQAELVVAAVTEIALLRAELSGPYVG